jgi:hypothetical protein
MMTAHPFTAGGGSVSPTSQQAWRSMVRRSLRLRSAYRRAAAEVREPGLRSVLAENADLLEQLIDEWRAHCRKAPPTVPAGQWAGALRRGIEAWRWRTMPHSDAWWIRVLARDEAALLRSFERALALAPHDDAPLLHRQRPRLDALHRDMRSLARAVGF